MTSILCRVGRKNLNSIYQWIMAALSQLANRQNSNKGTTWFCTRAVQPVATCCQSPYLHKPSIIIMTLFSLWRLAPTALAAPVLIIASFSLWLHYYWAGHAQHDGRTNVPRLIYTMIHKKRGSTFVIWKNSFDFYNFCTAISRKKIFIHTWKTCSPHLNNVLTLPCENETWHFILL